MQQPFDDSFNEIADSMGISLYQRFSVAEASLFLRCPLQELQDLITKKNIQYIQVSKNEVQLFGYQLLHHLLDNVVDHPISNNSQFINYRDLPHPCMLFKIPG